MLHARGPDTGQSAAELGGPSENATKHGGSVFHIPGGGHLAGGTGTGLARTARLLTRVISRSRRRHQAGGGARPRPARRPVRRRPASHANRRSRVIHGPRQSPCGVPKLDPRSRASRPSSQRADREEMQPLRLSPSPSSWDPLLHASNRQASPLQSLGVPTSDDRANHRVRYPPPSVPRAALLERLGGSSRSSDERLTSGLPHSALEQGQTPRSIDRGADVLEERVNHFLSLKKLHAVVLRRWDAGGWFPRQQRCVPDLHHCTVPLRYCGIAGQVDVDGPLPFS